MSQQEDNLGVLGNVLRNAFKKASPKGTEFSEVAVATNKQYAAAQFEVFDEENNHRYMVTISESVF